MSVVADAVWAEVAWFVVGVATRSGAFANRWPAAPPNTKTNSHCDSELPILSGGSGIAASLYRQASANQQSATALAQVRVDRTFYPFSSRH
jgi:uncharacterized protein YgbK (DUF1537 family)